MFSYVRRKVGRSEELWGCWVWDVGGVGWVWDAGGVGWVGMERALDRWEGLVVRDGLL